ncbi:MAG: transposase [Clostridiales Family XIII bacterium]|jgi:REP element-mobilizing transposase RayT|nr:transposase [Clostridiales Family XIII bacterium]
MPRKKRETSATGIYHVLLRGINKQNIFEEDEDYDKFLGFLGQVKKLSGFELYAYCLMGNHVHMLLKEKEESISMAIRRLGARYAFWFNWKYQRSGHLFQDRFKSEPVETDAYFITVINYIHQNPVKADICKEAADYMWGSRRYLGRGGNDLLNELEIEDIVSIDRIKGEEAFMVEDNLLEGGIGRRRRLSDAVAYQWMKEASGAASTAKFQSLTREKQQNTVYELRGKCVPIRQIARITGLSKGVVEHWMK